MVERFYSNNQRLSEKDKESTDYLVNCIDTAIAELVNEKDHLVIAYNYYNGVRDAEQFRFLEENYGIGNPTAVEFIPLIRRHVDALLGEHLQNKIKPKITCKDKKTLGKIEKLRRDAVLKTELDRIQSQFHSNLAHAYTPDEEKQNSQPPLDKATDIDIMNAKDETARTFLSEFEVSAQQVLTHLQQSKSVDLINKRKLLFLDLMIAGQCYYKVTVRHPGEVPKITVFNPFDVFVDRRKTGEYNNVKKAPRVVSRRWLFKEEVMNDYGHHMKEDDIDCLHGYSSYYNDSNMRYVRAPGKTGLIANVGLAIDPSFSDHTENNEFLHNLIPVYEVEWLATNKVEVDGETIYRMDRYKGVRIGGDIYVDMGKDDSVIRSQENPHECTLSVNGAFYSDRNGKPYSLVLATCKLQDKYDVLHFYRDTLIANSGVKGDWLDVSNLPTFLGATPAERIMKFKAYKKQGLAPINTAQEGRGANHNTVFAGFDDTVPGDAIQAIQFVIQQTEDTCSGITGVFRERLGNIEQRDAVTNVEVGIQTSATITKQYYQVMDSVTVELLIDALNACKESYKTGMVGSIIMGDRHQQIFTIQPKNFSFTDYDVHISDSTEIIKDIQDIKAITMELIKSGQADIDVVLEAIGTESLTQMKDNILKAFGKKKEEMNVAQQLQQQLQQAQEQMKQMQQEAQKIASENEQLKKQNTELDNKKVEYEYEVKKEANQNARMFNDHKIELDKSRVELEKLQLFDENKDNDEIKNV